MTNPLALIARLANSVARKPKRLRRYFKTRTRMGLYKYYLRKFLWHYRLRLPTVTVEGCQLRLPVTLKGIAEELQLFGVHEPLSTSIYSRLLAPGDTLLEVGCNIGYYMAVASRRIGPTGHIWAFEPDPNLFLHASQNARGMSPRISMHNMAVAERDGSATFHISGVANWGSLRRSQMLHHTEAVKVQTVSLDGFCLKHQVAPTVLRMDIEGGEVDALHGARTVLGTYRPKLFIEVHPVILNDTEVRSLLALLADCGYDKLLIVNRGLDWPWTPSRKRREGMQVVTIDRLVARADKGELPSVFGIFSCHG